MWKIVKPMNSDTIGLIGEVTILVTSHGLYMEGKGWSRVINRSINIIDLKKKSNTEIVNYIMNIIH